MNLTLPPVRSFRKFAAHQNAWADHYGALHVAAEYCGFALPERCVTVGLWQHGVFGPWDAHSPRLLVYNAPGGAERTVCVAREDQAELLRANGYGRARAIGLPILYTPAVDVRREPGSLLVMPGHALGGWKPTDRAPYQRYADEIAAIAPRFTEVAVCISPRDRKNGIWINEFTERGFTIIDGAETTDANALLRMRLLFAQFETVTTNTWGSHVAYGLAFGAKLSICGTLPTLDPATYLRLDAAWRADPQALRKALSAETEQRKREFLRAFHVGADAAVSDQELGAWLLGAKHKLSEEEMRSFLPEVVRAVAEPAQSHGSLQPIKIATDELPVVLVRSHEYNYSETFVEDHVNHLSKNLTLLYGYPFPRYVKGGKSVLPDATETKIQSALAAGGAGVTAELWREYSAGLAAFLKSCGARAALVESGLMGAFVHEACEQAALPFVVHFHGVDAFGRELLARWQGRYQRFFRTAASVVAVSKAMHAQLISLGASRERAVLGPYGVAIDLPARAEPAKAGPRFIAVGRFVEKKAPHLTLQAFALMQRRVPEARLVMIGDGPLLALCQKWAEANGLREAVTFTGVQSRDDVSRHLAASSVFVQHSITAANGDSEGLPLAVLEAGAHGLPVIATKHAGIPDAVRDGVDGLLVAEKDVAAMGAAMLRFAQDANLAARFGASFRARVESSYSRNRSIERLRALLFAAAERRSAEGLGEAVEEAIVAQASSPADTATEAGGTPAPRELISNDRNDVVAYLERARARLRDRVLDEAYKAAGEAHRLTGGTPETRELLQALEERGALGEPEVETYRRRAGWLPRRKSAQPRRILIVTNLLPPQEMGGYGRTMWEFSRELVARGHAVRVLTADMPHLLRQPSPEHAAFEPHVRRVLRLCGDWKDGVVVTEPDAERRREIVRGNHHAVLAAAKEFRPDAVMAGNLDFVGHLFVQELLQQGIPVLHRLGNAHPGYEPAQAPRSPLFCLAGCSEWVNANLRARAYPITRYAVIPPGSPLTEYFRAFPPQRSLLRIAFAGLLMPYKGAHVLVDALAYLQKAAIDFECTLAGDSTNPEYLATLRGIAAKHGFAERLHFPGFLGKTELAALYARCNVLVFPSVFEEPFGKTQIEAMAAGLLTISSGSGGAREIIRDGQTGLFFKGGDARDLAEKLARAHRHPALAQTIAAAGQADAFRFTTAASVDRLETMLQTLISAAQRKSPQLAA